jgi:Fe-S-cluster containining protein
MARFECNKVGECKRCGGCCHFREQEFLSKEEDLRIKGQIYLKTGIIYLYPFSRYTITVSEEEKKVIESEAKKLNIDIKILPKKIFYDADNDKVFVIDYFIDADVCPLWNKEKGCLIYEHRPEICKQFPNVTMQHEVDIEKLVGHKNIRLLNMKYEDIQEVIQGKLEKL